ncbi:TIGR02678 family protein [Nitriliruptoraceae bacterium ZYF776]|nr:TIGR02678 family protein [Profundirhabdus halotolerans]
MPTPPVIRQRSRDLTAASSVRTSRSASRCSASRLPPAPDANPTPGPTATCPRSGAPEVAILDDQQQHERATAIRALLATPLLTRQNDPDSFALAAVHRTWLTTWFDERCGWPLTVDLHGGFARLAKRRSGRDATRGARRTADGQPFDQLRYVLLFSVAAELVARPHTTIADLADTLQVVTTADPELPSFDPTEHRHRRAYTDVLRWLLDHGFAQLTAGDLDRYGHEGHDAVLEADVTRLAVLPGTARSPSHLDVPPTDHAGFVTALADEPRYGTAHDRVGDDDLRNRWARHQLLRELLDDPAVLRDQLLPEADAYLDTPTGRRVAQQAVADAGMVLERHAEVLLAIDARRQATDATFGDRASTVAQVAAVLLDELCAADAPVPHDRLRTRCRHLLDGDPGWATTYQDDTGHRRLAAAALDLLVAFALATVEHDEVTPTAAAHRFRVAVVDARTGAAAEVTRVPGAVDTGSLLEPETST